MKKLLTLLLLLIVLAGTTLPAQAVSPYTTWTLGPGSSLWPTQDAYTPLDQIDLPVDAPEDMFYAADGSLYIADTGNSRIIKLDAAFQVVAEYGVDILDAPTGLYVDEEGTLYIADAGKNTVIILDADGNLVNEFGRPSEPLFGANREFLPRKISVDTRRNLYIVSESSVDGLVMMNTSGNFIGYFGANSAEMSLKMILQRMFLTEDQLDQFIRNEAASPSNLDIDNQSLVYTITAGADRDKAIRKFTVSGRNLFDRWMFGSRTFRDITVSDDGLMVTVDQEGTIFEYDQNGALLFGFGGLDRGDQRLGLLSNPTAIERVGENLYVLDKEKNAVVTYQVTAFARELHNGVRLYMEGFYTEARPFFNDVLNFNGLVILSYEALASAAYKDSDYANALQFYRLAENRAGYSETFWELRNAVLQRHLGNAIGVMFFGWIAFSVFGRLERRYRWLDPVRALGERAQKIHLIDDFVLMFRFIKQPMDSFYYIKKNMRGSLLFAGLIYLWIVIIRVLALYLTGFVFSPYATWWQIDVEMEIVFTVVPLALWNIANYLIATISDGEGSLRHVIIGSAYSLFPYVLLGLPITLISNVLTLNEEFIYSFSMQLVWLWSGIMIVIMVKEVHNFSFGETVRNILATLFTMAMFLLTTYILYVLFTQLYEFVAAVIREVGLRG
ncbi:MAG: YIP1 family protein [Anaerolineae bacterium]|nr:YIP1 family protein [Anaerolineae bacterium]